MPNIRTITIGCPDEVGGKEGRREVAAFYSRLLGMRIIREDWLLIAKHPDSEMRIALDSDGWSDLRPPRWGDPEHPQQIHLDFFVGDLGTIHDLVLGLGATLLQDGGDHRTYADPVGHPFCLYDDPSAPTDAETPAVVGRVVHDCLSPRSLASFYEELLEMPERVEDTPERVVIAREGRALPMLAFQHAQFVPCRWPDPAYPAQLHLDLGFDDRTAAERAESLGGIRLPMLADTAVFADPAGHPFCVCVPDE